MPKPITGRPTLTQDRLRELLHYDPTTGLFTRLIPAGGVRVGQVAGHTHTKGYVYISVDGRLYRAHRLAWLYQTGEWPSEQVDHINHNRSDNRWSNLRPATGRQNSANRSMNRNASGAKGVTWDKKSGKWRAQIIVNGKHHSLGYFTSIEGAAAAYEVAARHFFGEFAHTEYHRAEAATNGDLMPLF